MTLQRSENKSKEINKGILIPGRIVNCYKDYSKKFPKKSIRVIAKKISKGILRILDQKRNPNFITSADVRKSSYMS